MDSITATFDRFLVVMAILLGSVVAYYLYSVR
jgi:hypothetical protein